MITLRYLIRSVLMQTVRSDLMQTVRSDLRQTVRLITANIKTETSPYGIIRLKEMPFSQNI